MHFVYSDLKHMFLLVCCESFITLEMTIWCVYCCTLKESMHFSNIGRQIGYGGKCRRLTIGSYIISALFDLVVLYVYFWYFGDWGTWSLCWRAWFDHLAAFFLDMYLHCLIGSFFTCHCVLTALASWYVVKYWWIWLLVLRKSRAYWTI